MYYTEQKKIYHNKSLIMAAPEPYFQCNINDNFKECRKKEIQSMIENYNYSGFPAVEQYTYYKSEPMRNERIKQTESKSDTIALNKQEYSDLTNIFHSS